MSVKTQFIYVGSEPSRFGGTSHAFYSPFYDKMWCFNYQDWDYSLIVGNKYDLAIPFQDRGYVMHSCSLEERFLGNTRHSKCEDIEIFRELYRNGNLFPIPNKDKHTEKVWVF